jgi:putative membrane protein
VNERLKKTEDKIHDNSDYTTWKESPYLILKGFLMGSADIVPGVSGGTMALITGIYNRLIFAIKSVDAKTVKSVFALRFNKVFEYFHWKFLLLLFTGMVLAVIFFTRVVPLQIYMYTHTELVYGLFFGLILGSVFLLVAEVDKPFKSVKAIVPLLAGTAFGFWIVTLVPADTPNNFFFIFLSGAVAICAMILPGISGSYILLIFRKYDYILSQLGALGGEETVQAAINLIPFFLGAAIGLILFSRILSWLLRNYHALTILTLIGFLIGSLYVIWPYQEREFQETVRDVEVLSVNHPAVQKLMDRDAEPKAPRYERIAAIYTRDFNGQEEEVAEVETVSRKLISSKPVFPWGEGKDLSQFNRSSGVTGGVIGLLLIYGIAFLRKQRPRP